VPEHHLYVCSQHSVALKNHLALREYLRTHPSDAAAYSALKKTLANQNLNERSRYSEGKTDFILSILERCGFSAGQLASIERANTTNWPNSKSLAMPKDRER
jgi:hypothetical protein